MSISGKWEGKLVDATGAMASIELNMADKDGRVAGDFGLYFLVDDPGCCGPQRRLSQTGEVRGQVRRDGSVRLDYKVMAGLKPVAVVFEGRLSETNGHAKQALLGCFEASDGQDALTLRGGGAVLWQYAGQ